MAEKPYVLTDDLPINIVRLLISFKYRSNMNIVGISIGLFYEKTRDDVADTRT